MSEPIKIVTQSIFSVVTRAPFDHAEMRAIDEVAEVLLQSEAHTVNFAAGKAEERCGLMTETALQQTELATIAQADERLADLLAHWRAFSIMMLWERPRPAAVGRLPESDTTALTNRHIDLCHSQRTPAFWVGHRELA